MEKKMKKMGLLINVILSIPKTIYLNFRVFDLSVAIKLPVFVSNNVKIKEIYKGCIKINSKNIKPFMIMLGIAGTEIVNSSKGLLYLNKNQKGKIVFNGKARFGEGIKTIDSHTG